MDVQDLLDFIGRAEAGPAGYQATWNNVGNRDFSSMSLDQVIADSLARGQKHGSGATGKYQFMGPTLRGLKANMGLTGSEPFTPELQDALGTELLREKGLEGFLSGDLPAEQFGANLADVWAGLPFDAQGASRYACVMGNKATTTWDDLMGVLGGGDVEYNAGLPQRRAAPNTPSTPTDTFGSIFSQLQAPAAPMSPVAQGLMALGDMFQLPQHRTGALQSLTSPSQQDVASRIQLARLLLDKQRMDQSQSRWEQEQQGQSDWVTKTVGNEIYRVNPVTGESELLTSGPMVEEAPNIGAVSPDKYTTESVAEFQQTGDYSVLTPTEKVASEKAPTEAERSSRAYYDRMAHAEEIITGLREPGQDLPGQLSESGLSTRWAQYAPHAWQSEETQQYKNAASQWIRAKLRKESGAVISEDEWQNEYETFFPKPGDSDSVIEQKRQARIEAMESLGTQAGRAAPKQAGNQPAPLRQKRFTTPDGYVIEEVQGP